jgi:hypothetical protein
MFPLIKNAVIEDLDAECLAEHGYAVDIVQGTHSPLWYMSVSDADESSTLAEYVSLTARTREGAEDLRDAFIWGLRLAGSTTAHHPTSLGDTMFPLITSTVPAMLSFVVDDVLSVTTWPDGTDVVTASGTLFIEQPGDPDNVVAVENFKHMFASDNSDEIVVAYTEVIPSMWVRSFLPDSPSMFTFSGDDEDEES